MKTTEHEKTGEKMHVYEVSFLVMPTVSEEQLPAEVGAIHTLLESAGAEIIAEDFPKLVPLAYTMEKTIETKNKKFNEGYFGWIKFELPVAQIANITKELDKRANILRHLMIKTVRENTLYSAKAPVVAEGTDASPVADAGAKLDTLVTS